MQITGIGVASHLSWQDTGYGLEGLKGAAVLPVE
jgi:hypothetical protein